MAPMHACRLAGVHGRFRIAHYPAAREIARSNEAGQASTEMLRQGMIHYRALFDDLLAVPTESERKELAR